MFRESTPTPKPFDIQWESRSASWLADIKVLLSPRPGPTVSARPFRSLGKQAPRNIFRGFVLSVLLHGMAFVLITQLNFSSGYQPPRNIAESDNTPIFLDMQALKELKILRALPVIRPSGPGGKPGTSDRPLQVVLQASTKQHPKFTVVLNPLKPDNARQAINQKMAAPDLKIQMEQKVPDIVMAEGPALKKPQVDMSLHTPVAQQKLQERLAEPAPTVAANSPDLPFKITQTVAQPQLPVSYVSGSLHGTRGATSSTGQSGATSSSASGDAAGGVVVISVDPGTFAQLASLAQGNRYGALAIAPSKEGIGSPGGSPNGTGPGGNGAPGKGGDGSSGVGAGHSGGGGGGIEVGRATMSATGGGGSVGGVDANKILGTVAPAAVYAVNSSVKMRRPPLVVATGPIGGGGLDAYGALNCGKVYTIFLPMPGKSWVLQYCAHGGAPVSADRNGTGVVQMEVGLVPPTADQQFDFHRLAIPEKDADKLIVLRGLIDKDGTISGVRVYQGVLPEMDAQAALAFSNWKFRPAMRASLPVSVDVLVGIPARVPEKMGGAPAGAQGNPN